MAESESSGRQRTPRSPSVTRETGVVPSPRDRARTAGGPRAVSSALPEQEHVSHVGDLDMLDGSSWHDACGSIAKMLGRERVTSQFGQMKSVLAEIRAAHGRRPCKKSIFALTVDPAKASQDRFQEALVRLGFAVWPVDFREIGMSPVPGGNDLAERSVLSLTPRIAFALGAQLRHEGSSDVVVVSHDFQLWSLMEEFLTIQRERGRESRIILAYFRSLLERRWRPKIEEWQREERGTIRFVNLEAYSSRIFGFEWPDQSVTGRGVIRSDGSVI